MKNKNLYLVFLVLISFSICCSQNDDVYRSPNQKALYPPNIESGRCTGSTYGDWKTSKFVLPYPVGETYSVDLSHCSGSYHSKGQPDQYAIDFSMEIGTTITASREGKVVHIEESGNDFNHPNNLVVVQHGDNTYAQYMHLTRDGARVKIGEQVTKGQAIGLSGATGLAGYPHLHFVVTSGSWKYPYSSIPKNFSNTTTNENSLQMGHSYQALPYED